MDPRTQHTPSEQENNPAPVPTTLDPTAGPFRPAAPAFPHPNMPLQPAMLPPTHYFTYPSSHLVAPPGFDHHRHPSTPQMRSIAPVPHASTPVMRVIAPVPQPQAEPLASFNTYNRVLPSAFQYDRTSTLARRPPVGWPAGHPPMRNSDYNGLHPSVIPDSAFLAEQDIIPLFVVRDPFASGSFDASRTPWWTHWVIAVAHGLTNLESWEICLLYKWRYRAIIPNIHLMTPTDEYELLLYIDGHTEYRYAFDWDEKDAYILRGWVSDYWGFASREQ